jgi:biopolymer transport protein ExbD
LEKQRFNLKLNLKAGKPNILRIKKRVLLSEDPVEMNLTPLIDVVFVVLIMFIVIAPLLSVEGVDLAASGPKSETISDRGNINLNIYIKKNDHIFWKNTKVSENELKRLLIMEKERHPNAVPNIFPDKEASYGSFQNVKNAVELAGFEKGNIVLTPS